MPLRDKSIVDVLPPYLEVGALHRVVDDVEEKRVVDNLQILVVADSRCSLCVRLEAPEQRARDGCGVLRQHGQQVDPVGREGRVGCDAPSRQQRWHPVHADGHLIGRSSLGNTSRPRDQRGYPQAPFEQLGLPACERPGIGEAFPAVVAGEHDDGVLRQTVGVQRLEHAPDLQIHVLDHGLVGLLRPAVEIKQLFPAQTLGLRFVSRRFPRPVGGIEMEAEQERLA